MREEAATSSDSTIEGAQEGEWDFFGGWGEVGKWTSLIS